MTTFCQSLFAANASLCSDSAGMPIFSGEKVQFGNCSGALEVYYSKQARTAPPCMPARLRRFSGVSSTCWYVRTATRLSRERSCACAREMLARRARCLTA
eukprot:6186817-Pleurochrysis_carterae.AAC.2